MVSSEYWFGAEASFYNGVATQSLRFDRGSNTYLTRTPSSASNRKTFTFSCWIKRANFASSVQTLIIARPTSTPSTSIQILDTNNIRIQDTGISMDLRSSRVFRDVSSWYHIVVAVDTTQSTSSNRAKLYINGSQETSFSTETYPTQDGDTLFNNTNQHEIGDMLYSGTTNFDGYMAEVNFVDGTQLTPTSFGETKNGVWIPKKYTGSYGTNGFRLQFDQTGTGSASSSTIGADTSGNNNHFTSSGIVASDCNMPDSPENNFATLNPLYATENAVFSEGNLRLDYNSGTFNSSGSTIATGSMKFYTEVLLINSTVNPAESSIGISNADKFSWNTDNAHSATGNNGVRYQTQNGNIENGYGTNGTGATLTSGDILGIACDPINGTLAYYKNGSLQDTVNIDTGLFYAITMSDASRFTNDVDFVVNFGQDSTFAGNKTSGSANAQDENSIGDFYYSVPSGFLALCTANLPEPTISPNADTQADDHFNTVLFSGTGSSPLSVTGVGFQPDWLWLKRRDNATNGHHILYDSIRGGTNALRASSNTAESQFGDMVITFASDGFSFTGTDGLNNSSSYSNVAWNWLGNGTTPTKTYKVVVVSDSGNKYRFRNSADSATFAQSAVTLELQEGGTYTFDLSDSSVDGHPMKFSTTSNGSHGGGSTYSTGVVYKLDGVTKTESEYVSGFNSATTRQIIITVASSAPVLYYFCHYHSGMGGQINTNTTHGSTNFDGSILSVSNPNTTSGFSIVTYTGSSSGNNGTASTIGHGLGIKPQWIWFIPRDTFDGCVYHSGVASDPATDKLLLATGSETDAKTGASDDSGFFNDTEPTTTVFSVGTRKHSNSNGGMVAYCFAEVESYSKFGSFIGNGSTDGTFVFTGFRPAWIMTKETSATSSWNIYDNVRSDDNPATELLIANSTNSEGTGTDIDIVSNGFKVRSTSGNINTSGNNYIYIAFAHMPFKYALAR